MTKTTTTCDHCGGTLDKTPFRGFYLEVVMEVFGMKLHDNKTFCSLSCLSEYLKPKTETTP